MKKFICLLIVMFYALTFQVVSVKGMKITPGLLLDDHVIEDKDYFYEDDKIVVYGNYTQFVGNNEINNIIRRVGNKILVFYNIKTNDNSNINVLTKNIHIVFINNEGILTEKSANFSFQGFILMKYDILSYYNESIAERSASTIKKMSSINEGLFQPVRTGVDRKLQAPFGYIDVIFTLYKYQPQNSTSTLYIIDMHTTFVSGRMAQMNTPGGGGFEEYLHSGSYVHLVAKQAEDWEEAYYHGGIPRRGGVPKLKDYWPINTPGTVTISSTYNTSMTLGYSFSNGFSTSNGSTTENGVDVGLTIGYSYSKSYSTDDPNLSAQLSTTDNQMAQWTYIYATEWVDASNHARNYILFEMNDSGHDMRKGDFNLYYKLKMTVRKPIYFLWWFSRWEYANVEFYRTWYLWN